MKYMNMKKKYQTLDLQLFAGEDEGGTDGEDSGDGDDQDDDESDEDGEEEKKFTQKDVDETVKKRLAREKRKWQREQQKKSTKKPDGHEESGESIKEDTEKAEAISKASKLEAKVACYEAGVSKDAVDDVTALARAYMEADEDLDLEDAIEKVVKKYPQFKKGAADPYEDEDETKGKSWGQRQNGKTPKKMSGVEKRFYELNPDLKK
ncbi:hypothetical protein [Dorea phocaeensis]|uniref:hypothetical protein n=1 Tax=Dorea phocaeensis TaxID=2040291 RepID=UPI000C75DE66|nr:hypothetical protein [Dorea phocaeensis]